MLDIVKQHRFSTGLPKLKGSLLLDFFGNFLILLSSCFSNAFGAPNETVFSEDLKDLISTPHYSKMFNILLELKLHIDMYPLDRGSKLNVHKTSGMS